MINILQNRETKYYYDEAMRLSKVELPDGETVSYRYDELNRVISQINSNRTGTNYTYTPAGRIKSIEHFKGLNGHGQVLLSYAYIYNARGQRILEVEGNGQVTAYQYDPVGRLTKVYYPFSGGKKEINRIERAHYFGLEVNLDNHKEYYRQKNNPDEYIAKLLYDYRNELDVLHREIRESGRPLDLYNNGYYIEEYRYDPAGNVIMEGNAWGTINFEYNAANQLIRAGNRTYSYDANGNLIKEGYGGDYVEYSYNYENRLIKASNLSRNDKLFGGEHPFTGTITFAYDALGRKVVKELAPANINRVMINGYYYDGGGVNILAEYEDEIWDINQYRLGKKNTTGQIPGGQVKYFNEYYYGLDLIAFNNMNHPNPWYINRDINFYHKDALGSITAITDRYENVVERYRYDAYGNPYEGRLLHMPKNNPYGFTGQRFEPELRMYSFAYRTYNPMSMRWMTVDPVRDGTNWYLYVSGDPVNLWDPLGLKEVIVEKQYKAEVYFYYFSMFVEILSGSEQGDPYIRYEYYVEITEEVPDHYELIDEKIQIEKSKIDYRLPSISWTEEGVIKYIWGAPNESGIISEDEK